MKKSTMKQTTDSKDSSALVNSIDLTPVKFDDGMSQKEALKKFLLQRQVMGANFFQFTMCSEEVNLNT